MHKSSFFLKSLELFLPKTCLFCDRQVFDTLCDDCFKCLSFQLRVVQFNAYSKLYFYTFYDDIIRRLFHLIKFNNYSDLLDCLSSRLYFSDDLFNKFDYWVPVPYHERRLKERGYHLLIRVFENFFHAMGICRLDLFMRHQYTVPLFNCSVQERRLILSDCFSFRIDIDRFKASRILIVDDIVTTGTTLSSLFNLLDHSCFKSIDFLSLSKVNYDHENITNI